jgi:hypothetical protein
MHEWRATPDSMYELETFCAGQYLASRRDQCGDFDLPRPTLGRADWAAPCPGAGRAGIERSSFDGLRAISLGRQGFIGRLC